MLEKIKETPKFDNIEIKDEIKKMQKELFVMQQKIKEKNIPVMILLDGISAAGKGSMLGKLSARMEPRGYKIHKISKDDRFDLRPCMYNFWLSIPPKGEMAIYDEAWYNKANTLMENNKEELKTYINEINTFERQLADDGYLIYKFYLHIDKKEQEKRLSKTDENEIHTWRVTKKDWQENSNYDKNLKHRDLILEKTNTPAAPWVLINNNEEKEGTYSLLKHLTGKLSEALENHSIVKNEIVSGEKFDLLEMQNLKNIKLNKEMSDDEFKKEYKKEKEKLNNLHSLLYQKKIPMVIAFEGWDAAGKGGAIRRLSWTLDARGFDVYSIAAPSKEELSKHYLYRFWNKLPKNGHIAMYDRSWYGRVMVERIEGFTKKERWEMAYQEINEFERSLIESGAIVLKFFIHIDKQTQLDRFNDRQNNPEKQFKITDEDWRNREKWDAYEEAINEMIHKTSTKNAPWIIVEGDNKPYARLKVIKAVRKALEEKLK